MDAGITGDLAQSGRPLVEFLLGDSGLGPVIDDNAKIGMLGIRIGLGWAKSHSFATGQCPVMKYNRALMQCILHDKIKIAKAVNVTTIKLEDAPKGYKDFDKGASKKFVLIRTAWSRR